MIPRYQRVLFVFLLVASLGMGGLLWWQLDRAHQRLLKGEDSAHTSAPQVAPEEKATLLVANDEENSLLPQSHSLPLPPDPGTRSRAILGKLLDLIADGTISGRIAKDLFVAMEETGKDPATLVETPSARNVVKLPQPLLFLLGSPRSSGVTVAPPAVWPSPWLSPGPATSSQTQCLSSLPQ